MKVKITKPSLPWIDYDKSYEVEDASDGGVIIIAGEKGEPYSFTPGEYEVVEDDQVESSGAETQSESTENHESEPAAEAPMQITAYDVKTKTKNVPMLNAVIKKTARGAYMAQGVSADGHKLTSLMNEEKALKAIKAGIAKQDW